MELVLKPKPNDVSTRMGEEGDFQPIENEETKNRFLETSRHRK